MSIYSLTTNKKGHIKLSTVVSHESTAIHIHRVGLRENLQDTPMIFMVKTMVSGVDFPLNQSNHMYYHYNWL